MVVGRYQNICAEVQVSALRRAGLPVLRRASGGGTVYHDPGNLNYSLMLPQQGMDYERCLRPVIDALNAIGVPAVRNRSCDIAIAGQKISGSAQWVSHGRLLHHGTLLFSADLHALDAITTRHKRDCFTSKGTPSAICPVTNIREHLSAPMDAERFHAALLDQMLPPGSPRLRLNAAQEAEVRRLRDEKYRSWEWIWGKTPTFSMERSGEFAGAPLHVRYCARRGIVSDFQLRSDALDVVIAAHPEVLNHNVETVKELQAAVRPQARYERSLNVLRYCKQKDPTLLTKTGFMVGLGETDEQIERLMDDILETGCDILTIGQYLQPTPGHYPLARYATPEDFARYKEIALRKGFRHVASAPLARSSYKAWEVLEDAHDLY